MPQRKKPLTETQARLKMADLCARGEQCEYDIDQKLYRMGLPADSRVKIIKYLKEHSFIDHSRYARSFARDKCRFSGWGPYKVRQGLQAKRIEANVISEAIDEVEESDWEEALGRAAAGKAKTLILIGEEGKNNRIKLARFLLSRGFRYEDVRGVVWEQTHLQKEQANLDEENADN